MKNNIKKIYLQFGMSFLFVIIINSICLLFPTFWSQLLIGRSSITIAPTFQDSMWLMFAFGVMLIYGQNSKIRAVRVYDKSQYLPQDFETIIDDEQLTEVIKKVKKDAELEGAIFPYMILQIALQFRTNNSISITSDFLSKQLDLFLHTVELSYNKLKYIIWLIPTLGFMGTVYGIGLAVNQLGGGSLDDPQLLTKMAGSLGIAFNTTLLALILSVILQFFAQHFESEEEKLINDYGKEIMDNLINRLVEKA